MLNTRQINNHTKRWKLTMITIISSIILSKPTTPIQSNSTKIIQPIFEQHISQNSITTLKTRKQGYNYEILRENKKTHTFSWGLKLKWWRTMEVFVRNMVSLRVIWTDKTMNNKKCSRENWKVLKKFSKKCKTCVFHDWNKSRTSR